MENKIKLIADSFGRDRVKLNEPVKDHTTMRRGGKAALFMIAFKKGEIIRMVKMARELNVPLFIFGTGSKMMISDSVFAGVVIKNRTSNISVIGIKGKVQRDGLGVREALVEVESGTSIAKLVEFLKKQNLIYQDLEGIVGTVGGNLFLNTGLQEKVQSIKILDEYSNEEGVSMITLNLNKHIILSAIFKFKSQSLK